jgi:DNA-binding transcriptional MerR regulator
VPHHPSESTSKLGLGSREVCDLIGLPSSTLNYWVQIGLVEPTIRGPQGRRVEQYWSVEDVVIVRSVRELRRAGASLQQVRKASRRLAEWGSSMSNARLYWDGADVIVQTVDGDLVSTIERPGQLVWFLAALPLGKWHDQTSRRARSIEVDEFRQRDRQRLEAHRKKAVPFARLVRAPKRPA